MQPNLPALPLGQVANRHIKLVNLARLFRSVAAELTRAITDACR